jgi:hypothetical protein
MQGSSSSGLLNKESLLRACLGWKGVDLQLWDYVRTAVHQTLASQPPSLASMWQDGPCRLVEVSEGEECVLEVDGLMGEQSVAVIAGAESQQSSRRQRYEGRADGEQASEAACMAQGSGRQAMTEPHAAAASCAPPNVYESMRERTPPLVTLELLAERLESLAVVALGPEEMQVCAEA